MNTQRRAILHWLTARLAAALEVSTANVDPLLPLTEMGVDSVHAVSLAGEIEAHFGIDVDPTLTFDYPTLSHIAEFIGSQIALRATRALDGAVA